MNSFYEISGVNVGVFDDQHLVIEPFSSWLWDSVVGGWNGAVWNFTTTFMPDMRVIGINGCDRNPNGSGNMPPDGCYDIYMLANPTTNDVGFIVTLGDGSFGSLVKPAGYTQYRKLMYGILIRNGKLEPNHTANWPMPTIELTNSDTALTIATFTNTGGWVAVDFSKLIPENARLGMFAAETTGTGSFWISPTNNVPNQYWKTPLNNQTGISGTINCRIDSTQKLYVWYQGTGTCNLILRGWKQTEVS